MTGQVVWVRAERASNGPHGLVWPHDGAVVAIDDVPLAHAILRIPGFTEAAPAPDHTVTEPAPEPDEVAKPAKGRTQRTKVEE